MIFRNLIREKSIKNFQQKTTYAKIGKKAAIMRSCVEEEDSRALQCSEPG